MWLAKVAERQMIRPSFVPPPEIRLLRDLTRYRADLVNSRTAEKNRVEKLLEDAQIKLSVVASDIFGVSGREMMAALLAGQRDPKPLAQLARSRMRAKIPLLEEAFVGNFTDHHDKNIMLWDVARRERITQLPMHSDGAGSAVFSPDGRVLATPTDQQTIILWDAATRAHLATLQGPIGPVTTLAFSPDSRTLASGGNDGTIALWDVASRERRAVVPPSPGTPTA